MRVSTAVLGFGSLSLANWRLYLAKQFQGVSVDFDPMAAPACVIDRNEGLRKGCVGERAHRNSDKARLCFQLIGKARLPRFPFTAVGPFTCLPRPTFFASSDRLAA